MYLDIYNKKETKVDILTFQTDISILFICLDMYLREKSGRYLNV